MEHMEEGEKQAKQLEELEKEISSLKLLLQRELNERKSIEFNLQERLKEVNCHNQISKLMAASELSTFEVIEKIVQIIPSSWQFPDFAEAKVAVYDQSFQTPGYKTSRHLLSQEIKVNEGVIGRIEVCYPEHQKLPTQSPFLNEETDLLFGIAQRIGNFIEKSEKEIALQQSEAKYKELIENISDVIYTIDNKANITYISPSITKILGYTPEEIIGRNFVHFVGVSGEQLQKRFVEIQNNIELQNEYQIVAVTGEPHWIRFSSKAMYKEGQFTGVSGTLIDITDKKVAEEKLRKSEESFRNMVEALNDVIYEITNLGVVKYVSPSVERILGYGSEELIGQNIFAFMHPDDKPVIVDRLANLNKRDYTFLEYRYFAKDGSIRWVRSSTNPIVENGEIIGGRGVLIDITNRKKAEEEVRESEERFRLIFDNVFDGISIFEEAADPQNRKLIECNERYAEMAGRSREELLKLGYTNRLTKPLAEKANEARLKGIDEHNAYQGSFTWIRPDGKENTIEYIARPISWQGKSYSIGIDRDVTEYRLKEDKLRKLSQAVEQSPVSIVITDPEGNIEYANPQACNTTGYTLEELKGKNPRVLKSGETPIDEYQHLWNSISKGISWKGIFQNKRKNGELYWESSQITPITDENGIIRNYLAIKEDITERKAIQEALQKSEERFSQIAIQSKTVIWEVDLMGLFTYVSPVAETVWGYTPEEIIGKKFFYDLHPEEGRIEFKKAALESIHRREHFLELPNQIVTRDNRVIWVSTNGVPVLDHQNKLIGYRGADNEITERVLALENLRQSEERYKSIFQNNHSVMLILDPDTGDIRDVNTSACNYYKWSYTDMCSKNISEINILPPREIKAELRKAKEEKRSHFFFKHRLATNEIRDVEVYSCPISFGENGLLFSIIHDVTDKKLAEESLKKSEFELNLAQRIAKMGSWDLNMVTNKLTWSRNYYDFLEIEPGVTEPSNDIFMNMLHPDDHNLVDENLHKMLVTKEDVSFEMRLIMPGGRIKWVQNTIVPHFEDEILVSLKGVNTDITRIKLADESIKMQNDKLKAIIDAMPDLIFVVDKNGTYLEYYSPTPDLLAVPDDLIVGTNLKDIFEPETVQLHLRMIEECLEQQKLITYDFTGIDRNKIKFSEVRLAPLGTERVLTFVRDITDEKLKDNEIKKLSLAVEQSPVIAVITDLAGNIEYVNPAFMSITGYTAEDVIGKNARILKSGKTERKVYEKLWKTITAGDSWYGEWINKKKNGELYWENVSITPIRSNNGIVTNYLAIKQDITQRKQIEQEIQELNASLEARIKERTFELEETNINLTTEIEVRKTTQQALAKSEESYRTVVENVNEVIFQTDAAGLWVFLNRSWEKVTGYSVEESIGQLFVNYVHPDDRARNWELFEPLIQRKKEYCRHEIRYLTKDGGFRWVEVFARLGLNENNEITGTFGTLMDITDRRLAEELINLTRQNYETFFNTIDDFLWVLDEQGNIIHTNETVRKRLEYSEPELLNHNVLMVHPAERREEAGRIVGEMLAGTAEFCPVPVVTKSGKNIPVETRVKSGFWNSVPVIFGVSKDISQIQLSEQKFSSAFQSNSAMMSISHYFSGEFIDINTAFIETLDFTRQEVIGKTSKELGLFVESETRKQIIANLEQNIPVRKFEVELQTKNGSIKTGLLSADSIFIGETKCLLTVVMDITERKIMEDELREARKEAEKANIAKSEFLSRMSHELRTPMNSILGFAQLLEMGDLNSGQKKGVNHILKSGRHLLDLINEVLDISRIEAGRLTLSLEPVRISGIISEMIDIVKPQIIERNIRIEPIESETKQLFVKSDRQRLKQIILNLLNNAIKYNREDGIVWIKTELKQNTELNEAVLRISISDTGSGISEEDLPKLFNPFERIGAEKSATEGTGLGLSVVKKLIEAMSGKLGVESQLGIGSTFWIELPCSESPLEHAEKFGLLNESELNISTLKGTILYIEDNASNIELVEQVLANQRSSIKLISNTTGNETVQMAIDYHPDLILLDLDLPDVHGSKVLKRLQADERTAGIPVVIISADAMPQQIQKLLKAGAQNYLTKPLDVIDFLRVVDEFMSD